MNRRDFIKFAAGAGVISSLAFTSLDAFARPRKRKPVKRKAPVATTESVFASLMKSAQSDDWKKYSIGALIGLIGQKLIGTPYVGGTLEVNENSEECVVNLIELDCVTLCESTLALARMIKKDRYTVEEYTQELTYIRYRGGKIYNYASRLHYTSDWIFDNVKKDVVDDISSLIGGEQIKFDVYFMSENSELYPQLRKTPKLIAEIGSIEDSIRKRDYYYIPNAKVAAFSDRIQTGDMICIVTSKAGLDYSHTGIAYVENGTVRLLHASSKEKKVILDSELSQYLAGHPSGRGISVVRPKEL